MHKSNENGNPAGEAQPQSSGGVPAGLFASSLLSMAVAFCAYRPAGNALDSAACAFNLSTTCSIPVLLQGFVVLLSSFAFDGIGVMTFAFVGTGLVDGVIA